jgi:hypothetical protein
MKLLWQNENSDIQKGKLFYDAQKSMVGVL